MEPETPMFLKGLLVAVFILGVAAVGSLIFDPYVREDEEDGHG